MATLFIGAPWDKIDEKGNNVGKPGAPGSFETYLKTSIGKEYAIWKKWALIIKSGWTVVLLRNDQDEKRAEGILVDLKPTGKYIKGVQRYDVHIRGLTQVPYKRPPKKLNRFGVLVIDC